MSILDQLSNIPSGIGSSFANSLGFLPDRGYYHNTFYGVYHDGLSSFLRLCTALKNCICTAILEIRASLPHECNFIFKYLCSELKR